MKFCLRNSSWVALSITLSGSGCVVEKIDAIIAEHGVTYWPSSTDEGSESSTGNDTSTSTSTSTSSTSTTTADASDSLAASTSIFGTGSTDGSSSSTGPGEPICGNSVVEGDETCDDGNADPDDGCKECARDSLVFISSETYKGWNLGGLYGADQRCRSLAAKAGISRPESFRAWLSTQVMPAADRITHSRGRYILVNGLVIAHDWDALTSGALLTTITVDEYSQNQDTKAWTGTLADGQPSPGSEFCGAWDDDSGLVLYGGSGRSQSMDSQWSFFSNVVCDADYSLYCFEN